VTASPDGKVAYVPIYGDSGVGRPGSDGRNMMVIEIASGKTVGNVDFGKGVRPHHPVLGPKNGLLYVTTELDNTVTVIDPKTLKILGAVPTGAAEAHMLAISSDGKRGYTANVGPGSISVLDLDAKKTVTVIQVAKRIQRVALSTDGKVLWTADQGEPRLAAIDTATNKVDHWIPLPAVGFSTAPTPDGKFLVITSPASNKVFVLDLKARSVVHTLDMPKIPQEVIVRPDGKMAYVSCDIDAKVVAVRTSDWKVDATMDAGKGADGLAWAGK
jgi:YVTN family beta-propeller protein